MTTTQVHSITDEQIAEIEALARAAHKSTVDLYLYANSMTPSLLFAIITRLREAEKDAARYRWLRKSNGQPQRAVFLDSSTTYDMDEAIDTAMQEQTK